MYYNREIQVKKGHELYSYFDEQAHLANNCYNAALFRMRQVMTAVKKDPSAWTDHEREVMEEIEKALPDMGTKYHMPDAKHWVLGSFFMRMYMHASRNPDYNAKGFSSQIAQHVVGRCSKAMKSFSKAMVEYHKDPSKFTGKPKVPGYRRKQGTCGFDIPNNSVLLRSSEDGTRSLMALPLTEKRMNVDYIDPTLRLKQVTVTPGNEMYSVHLVLEAVDAPEKEEIKHERICAIDFGVNNLMAVTNNIGAPCLLYKGGVIKAANQLFNKTAARLAAKQTKGTTKKFVGSRNYYRALRKRNNRISDDIHKTAKSLVQWCVDNNAA